MKHIGTKEIQTDRLLLRRWRYGDEQQMFNNIFGDPVVTEHISWGRHETIDDTVEFLKTCLKQYQEQPDFYGWAIEKNGRAVGSIGAFDVNEAIRSCELGYSLSREFWGQGIVTEAVEAILRYLFNEVGFNRITASYNAENIASGKVMQKVNMKYEGTLREATLRNDGTYGDLVLYAILKNEYI